MDTSTARGEVAVVRGGETLLVAGFESERSHNAQMFSPLREALEAAGDDLGLIVVGTGPGSYTGVRIGIAAAQGLAWSRGVPVVGISSLLAPVSGSDKASFVMCGDARRGLFYWARVVDGAMVGEIESVPEAEFRAKRAELSEVPWFSFESKVPGGLEGVELARPSALSLARLGRKLGEGEKGRLTAQVLEPVYLSAPFVTAKKVS
ncbi:tRNA (adenosine(37)-N6)-threonylcarbamoyltransferase complex dimerization subunit type 1 TsaB [Phragmitibacter flavus]|nr:tRNA (adenosine(37)-N6)-threonylcarbamoyltransferase complex dimerization subunit type 1 TsaB [Phragmitibacter flavus]